MPELGLIVNGLNGRIESCSWEEYAKFISAFMQINQKYNVMALLKANMDWIEYPDRCSGIEVILPASQFSNQSKRDLKSILAIQIFSLAYELTENLAAVCYAYAQAIHHGVVYFALLLRDFGISLSRLRKTYDETTIDLSLANANAIYQVAIKEDQRLIEFFGDATMLDTKKNQRRHALEKIVRYRYRFKRWYNIYKHTHSTVPLQINHPSYQWSIIHHIPDSLSVIDTQFECNDLIHLPEIKQGGNIRITTIETGSFLSAMEIVNDANEIGLLVLEIWKEVRRDRHNRLFREVI